MRRAVPLFLTLNVALLIATSPNPGPTTTWTTTPAGVCSGPGVRLDPVLHTHIFDIDDGVELRISTDGDHPIHELYADVTVFNESDGPCTTEIYTPAVAGAEPFLVDGRISDDWDRVIDIDVTPLGSSADAIPDPTRVGWGGSGPDRGPELRVHRRGPGSGAGAVRRSQRPPRHRGPGGAAMRPGDVLIHPIALAATALYALNDHILKEVTPGLLSGKLSDVAGLVVLPLTLLAIAEITTGRIYGRRALIAAVGISAAGFAAVEVWPVAEAAWCWTWGALQWPFLAGSAWISGSAVPPITPVITWSDPTDLLTLPAALAALAVRR